MTRMSVAEFKANFSEALELVKNGEEVEVLYGRTKKPVAKLVPAQRERGESLLGCLEGKMTFTMSEDWKFTPNELEELFGL